MSDDTTLTADVVAELVATLDDRDVDPDIGPRHAFRALETLLTLRNMTDHCAAVLVGHLDRLGVATTRGRALRELVLRELVLRELATCLGVAPAAVPPPHTFKPTTSRMRPALVTPTSTTGAWPAPQGHHDIHDRGWEVLTGADHHPWLIPPASVPHTAAPNPPTTDAPPDSTTPTRQRRLDAAA